MCGCADLLVTHPLLSLRQELSEKQNAKGNTSSNHQVKYLFRQISARCMAYKVFGLQLSRYCGRDTFSCSAGKLLSAGVGHAGCLQGGMRQLAGDGVSGPCVKPCSLKKKPYLLSSFHRSMTLQML